MSTRRTRAASQRVGTTIRMRARRTHELLLLRCSYFCFSVPVRPIWCPPGAALPCGVARSLPCINPFSRRFLGSLWPTPTSGRRAPIDSNSETGFPREDFRAFYSLFVFQSGKRLRLDFFFLFFRLPLLGGVNIDCVKIHAFGGVSTVVQSSYPLYSCS